MTQLRPLRPLLCVSRASSSGFKYSGTGFSNTTIDCTNISLTFIHDIGVMGSSKPSSASPEASESTKTLGSRGATVSAASRALAIDHISDLICGLLDTPTLLSALRVNYSLYHSAGKVLYRHLHLACNAPLAGALVGNELARQQVLDEFHPCEGVAWEEIFCLWKLSTLKLSQQRPVKRKGKPGKKGGVESPGFTAMRAQLAYLGVTAGEVRAFLAHLVDNDIGQLHSSPIGKRKTRNFKLPLLHHVRVLTISSHHRCSCTLWGAQVAHFFPNVEVLRVVPTVSKDGALLPLCDGADKAPCPFLQVDAEKLVLRNLDARGPAIPGHLAWTSPKLQRVSIYLPVDGAECARIPALSLKGQFPGVKEINIIFHVWDGARVVDVLFPHKHPHLPETLIDLLQALTIPGRADNTKINIYGLDEIAFHPIGPFATRADALMDTITVDPAFSPSMPVTGTPLASFPDFLVLGLSRLEDEEYAKFFLDLIRCDVATGFMKTVWRPGRTDTPTNEEIRKAMAPVAHVSFDHVLLYFDSKECEEDEQLKTRGIWCACKHCL